MKTERELQVADYMHKCVHFNGVFINQACKAGVVYHELLGTGVGCFKSIPCTREGGSVKCPKRKFHTREEAEKEVTAVEMMWNGSVILMNHVAKDAKSKGFGKGVPGTAEIGCPLSCQGKVKYGVASNGHRSAACDTCGMSFME